MLSKPTVKKNFMKIFVVNFKISFYFQRLLNLFVPLLSILAFSSSLAYIEKILHISQSKRNSSMKIYLKIFILMQLRQSNNCFKALLLNII